MHCSTNGFLDVYICECVCYSGYKGTLCNSELSSSHSSKYMYTIIIIISGRSSSRTPVGVVIMVVVITLFRGALVEVAALVAV